MDEEDDKLFSPGEAYRGTHDARPYPVSSGQSLQTIGELARDFGITSRALRFYEAKGLLTPQRHGGARRYGPAERELLAQLLKAKALGFTLAEIRTMVGRPAGSEAATIDISRAQCLDQIRHLEQRKHQIEAALAELRRTYSLFYVRLLAGTP